MAGIPLSDDYPPRRTPVVTYLLIGANVAVYLLSPLSAIAVWYGTGMSQMCAVNVYMQHWSAVPVELLTGEALPPRSDCPGSDFAKVPWISSITALFLHGSPMHLMGNMIYLFVFGPCVEDRLGRFRFLAFYLICGVFATYAFALGQPNAEVPLVGASGAISGVLGAYLMVQFRSRVVTLVFGLIPVRLPGWVLVATYFVLQYFLYVGQSFFPNGSSVAYAAHVYGFAAGALGGFLVYRIRWRISRRLSSAS